MSMLDSKMLGHEEERQKLCVKQINAESGASGRFPAGRAVKVGTICAVVETDAKVIASESFLTCEASECDPVFPESSPILPGEPEAADDEP
jgi:hypothetical protein